LKSTTRIAHKTNCGGGQVTTLWSIRNWHWREWKTSDYCPYRMESLRWRRADQQRLRCGLALLSKTQNKTIT